MVWRMSPYERRRRGNALRGGHEVALAAGNAHYQAKGLWALGGSESRDAFRTQSRVPCRPDIGTRVQANRGARGVCEPALELPSRREGQYLENGVQSRGQNRTRESRPSGIVGGLPETWSMAELGSHPATERAGCGNPPPTDARTGDLSRQPHARICEGEAEWPSYSTIASEGEFS